MSDYTFAPASPSDKCPMCGTSGHNCKGGTEGMSGISYEQNPVNGASGFLALEHIYECDEDGDPLRLRYAPGEAIHKGDVADLAEEGFKLGDKNLTGDALRAAIATAKAERDAEDSEEPEEIVPPVVFAVSPSFITFTGTAGGDLPSAATVSVNKPEYLAVVPSDVEWLTATPQEDGTFVVSCGALAAGTYSATIAVKSYDEEATVSVSASIAAAPPVEEPKVEEVPPVEPATTEPVKEATAKEGEVKPETKDVRGPKDTPKPK